MTPAGAPGEVLWSIVAGLGTAPWWFKAGCALLALLAVYRLPRHWEQLPLMLGLLLVGLSPLLPAFGPFGDWLVYPAAVAVLLRAGATHRRGQGLTGARRPSADRPLTRNSARS